MGKNIVIACDGTSNSPVKNRTNVCRLWLSLEQSERQIVYYDPGVGTLSNPMRISTVGKKISRGFRLATGSDMAENVMEAYRFLSDNYEEDDAIYLFGFSRGAYTVRALAGMIKMCGLLPPHTHNLVPHLWQIYSNDGRQSTTFRKRYVTGNEIGSLYRKPPIKMIGVWDTVSSWGLFFNFRSIPHTAKLPNVDHIRHAVAIDERRAAFRANLFSTDNRDLQEVWFAGTHCDVGGGHPEQESGLSKLAFQWMVDEARGLGVHLNEDKIKKYLGQANRSGGTQYAEPDHRAELHESVAGFWKALEHIPRRWWVGKKTVIKDGKEAKVDQYKWRSNRGQRRYFDAERGGTAVHLSVGDRVRDCQYSAPYVTEPGEDNEDPSEADA